MWGLQVPAFSQQAEYLALHLIAKGLKAVGQIQPLGKADKIVHRVGTESRLPICSQIGKFHAHNPGWGRKSGGIGGVRMRFEQAACRRGPAKTPDPRRQEGKRQGIRLWQLSHSRRSYRRTEEAGLRPRSGTIRLFMRALDPVAGPAT